MHQENLRQRAPQFELIAGALCLDFVNTLDDRFSNEPKELLPGYADLARFGEDAGILTPQQLNRLLDASEASPGQAKRVLQRAIQFREAMHEVFWAIVTKKPVPQKSLSTLNEYVHDAAQHANLVTSGGRFEWLFDRSADDLDAPLWPIARSATNLLVSDQLQFVRACASKTCEWLFLDESKNHRRRWCDMTKCGNRAKVHRFYARQRKA